MIQSFKIRSGRQDLLKTIRQTYTSGHCSFKFNKARQQK